jgi:kynurenine formamidase
MQATLNSYPCLTIHLALSERGGIAGRGVLLDFVRFARRRGIEYDVFSNYPISLDQIKDMITDQCLVIFPGDILIVRTGLSKVIRESDPRVQGFWSRSTHIGVDPTAEFIEWIWNQNLAALASDAVAFECIPASDKSSEFSNQCHDIQFDMLFHRNAPT